MNIFYIYQAHPVYQTSVWLKQTYQVCLVKIMCHQNRKGQCIFQWIHYWQLWEQKQTTWHRFMVWWCWVQQDLYICVMHNCTPGIHTSDLFVFYTWKLRKLISLYIASPQVVNAAAVDTSSTTSNIFQYILSTICILILTDAIIKMIIRGDQYFHRYQTTTHFLCEHGHDKGPSISIAL